MASKSTHILEVIIKARDELFKALKNSGVKSVKELKKLVAGLKAVDALEKRAAAQAKKTGAAWKRMFRIGVKGAVGFARAFTPMFAAFTSAQLLGTTLRGVFTRLQSAMRVSVLAAAAFSIAMGEISTILPDAERQMVGLSREVKNLSVELNKPALDVAKGLYQAISAGFSEAADAMILLRQAAKLGTAGLADTADTIDLLTTTVNAYRREVSDATEISDVFFETVRLGKTTITELASDVGKALPLASSLGVSIEEVAAGMATLTQEGFNTGEAMTAMRALFKALLRQVGQLNLVFNKTGQQYTLQTIRANGLAKTLEILRASVDDDSEAMLVLGGRVEAASALFGLTGQNLSAFQRILKGIQDSSGATEKALAKMMAVDAFFLEQSFNALKVESLAFGKAVITGAAKALRAYGDIEDVQATLRATFEGLAPTIERITESVAEWSLSFLSAGDGADLLATRVEVAFNSIEGRLGSFFGVFFKSKLEESRDAIEELESVVADPGHQTTRFTGITDLQREDTGIIAAGLRNDLTRAEVTQARLVIEEKLVAKARQLLAIERPYNTILEERAVLEQEAVAAAERLLKTKEIAAKHEAKLLTAIKTDFGEGNDAKAEAFLRGIVGDKDDALDAAEFRADDFAEGFINGLLKNSDKTQRAAGNFMSKAFKFQGNKTTIEREAKKAVAFFDKTIGKAVRKAVGLPNEVERAGASAEIQATLRLLTEETAQRKLLLGITKGQRRVGREQLDDLRERLALAKLEVVDKINKEGSDLNASAFFPASAELDRAMLDSLRGINFNALLDLGGAHALKLSYDENPEEFRRVLALLPADFEITFVPVVDRSEIGRDLAGLRGKLPQTVEQEVAQQVELNRLDEEAATNKRFSLTLTQKEVTERKALIAAVREFKDVQANLGGDVRELTFRKELLELQFGATESIDEQRSIATELITVTGQLAGMERFRQGIADGLSVARANELGDLVEIGASLDDLRAKDQARALAGREVARIRETELSRNGLFGSDREAVEQASVDERAAALRERLMRNNVEDVDKIVLSFKEANRVLSDTEIQILQVANGIKQSFVSNLDNAFGGFIDGTLSAKDAFSEFAKAVVKDTLRMIAVQATLFAISGGSAGFFAATAAAKGGVFEGGLGTAKPFAKGGIGKGGFSNPLMLAGGGLVTKPSFAVIGEGKNNEAVVPLPDNRSIPVTFTKGGGGGTTVMQTIQLNVSAPVQAIDMRDFGQRLGEVGQSVGEVVKTQIVQDPSLLRALRLAARGGR